MADTHDESTRFKRPLRYVMGLFYVGAGVTHFLVPDTFAEIVPQQLPRPVTLVYLSGVAEIVLGAGVLLPRTRRWSAWGLVALLIAVFPANVNMAVGGADAERAGGLGTVAAWLRLPLQAVLVGWAWWYTRAVDEPTE